MPDSKKRVYVADDDPTLLQLVAMSLSALSDVEVSVFEDGLQLLRAIQKGPSPDAIVTDIILPRLEGLALARLLKFDETWRHIPILVISTVIDADIQQQVDSVGADAFLRKPFRPNELRERVKALLDGAAPRLEAR